MLFYEDFLEIGISCKFGKDGMPYFCPRPSCKKMLACGTPLLGSHEFCCENPDCTHSRIISQSCKRRGCPVCGKKATELWIATMMARLPDTCYQNGTFTMPDTLCPLFDVNRWLLGAWFALAADNLIYAVQKRSLTIGIFGALHTYCRQLNWHCHIHLSWTTGGIHTDGNWKAMRFDLPKVKSRWMWNVRQFLLEAWDSLTLPPSLAHLRDYDEWKRFVLSQGKNEKEQESTGTCLLLNRRSMRDRRQNTWADP